MRTRINPEMAPAAKRGGEMLAEVIADTLPHGYGFALLIFDDPKPGQEQTLSYIGNCERSKILEAMREFIAKHADG